MADETRPARRPHAGQWKPGQSGNPAGRVKGVERMVREFVREQGADGLDGWGRIMRAMFQIAMGGKPEGMVVGTSISARDRRQAAEFLWDRGFGKPRQTLDVTQVEGGQSTIIDVESMSEEEVDRVLAAMEAVAPDRALGDGDDENQETP